jgi:hypothetical protein
VQILRDSAGRIVPKPVSLRQLIASLVRRGTGKTFSENLRAKDALRGAL